MKKNFPILFSVIALLLLLGALLCYNRSTAYTCAETGSSHGTRYIGFIPIEEWEKSSWIEQRANKLGILPAKLTWVKTADTRDFLIMQSRGHGRAPVSLFIGSLGDEHLEYEYSSADLDDFVREFIAASEERRKEMEHEFFDGAYQGPAPAGSHGGAKGGP